MKRIIVSVVTAAGLLAVPAAAIASASTTHHHGSSCLVNINDRDRVMRNGELLGNQEVQILCQDGVIWLETREGVTHEP